MNAVKPQTVKIATSTRNYQPIRFLNSVIWAT